MIFVSSTFTDTHNERNYIFEYILPSLQALGNKYQIQINFIDMRYGIRDENTLDHKTWILCKNELDKCIQNSGGLYFLSLQSSKYGYQPIPKYVNASDLDGKIANLQSGSDYESLNLIREWYSLDSNHIPPRYTLRSLYGLKKDVVDNFWSTALPKLRRSLHGIHFDDDCDSLVVGQSITHWECLYAISHDDTQSHSRCIWSHRMFGDTDLLDSILANDSKELYYDCTHATSILSILFLTYSLKLGKNIPEKKLLLSELLDYMSLEIGSSSLAYPLTHVSHTYLYRP